VLVVAPLYHDQRGGLGRQAKLIAERLATDPGFEILVATRLMKGLPPTEWSPKVAIARLRNPRPNLHNYDQPSLGNLLVSLSFCAQLMALLWSQRRRYDLVHVHGASLPLIAAIPVLRLLGKPIVAKVAGTDQGVEAGDLRRRYSLLGRFLAWTLSAVDRYIATTPQIATALRGEGYPESLIERIPNVVETERLRPTGPEAKAQARAELGLAPEAIVMLYAGRLVPLKRVEVLLQAIATLDDPRLCLLIAGDGPERGALETLAARLGLEAKVRFLGFRGDMERLFAAADGLCLQSEREGLPNIVLEAMACALPIVATELGGCREALGAQGNGPFPRQEDAGFLVSVGSVEELAEAIEVLASEPEMRDRMGSAGRQRVEEFFGLDAALRRYRALYRELGS